MSHFFQDSVFWVELDKIKPNPYQPRREFDEAELKSLADSIRQYGLLQALVVTRTEVPREDGGLAVEYELIAGERRLRASKIAGLSQVPVLIKSGEESGLMKLELAIIENVQREDLNAVDRARAFDRLASEFGLKHVDIAKKIGKSREYVSNTMRILALPDDMLSALAEGQIAEGHTRPLLMLIERPDEQRTLFKEIIHKKMPVREAELIARGIAFERARKRESLNDPEIATLEHQLSESLGTRVKIEAKEKGGKIHIDYFSPDDLRFILEALKNREKRGEHGMLNDHIAKVGDQESQSDGEHPRNVSFEPEEKKEQDFDTDDMYSISNFSV
ncbi:MAG: hypothetical protein COV34_01465 [Candidatus Zambryskibacteria bacterium CG10_big_fil_rev_8_21_14_0_10_42_12]|uniref:ParB-like N-terminal domain-containing protein n=1 Tax=Candidatus Zambryskibacteria bacterium CG10_big_fil_rev_8_21_14_0_10_42_12 TaxID=1975115 RepID=A0A2H0QVF1_9BACT|nr:MAG: hypothetical protein COV34_01465 [Candidatus Zambryskibacteria bacterium CG10_big_fil_rev_8_21_14_0_10_42_12]